jgi:hypothetical protein
MLKVIKKKDNLFVPNMQTGYCLDPEGNGVGLGGVGVTGPGPPERGKDRQLKPSEGRDNWKRMKKNSPFGREGGGSARSE